MKYYQSDKKPLNYFEWQKRRQQLKKYRYYFFDYMYYCGEKWSEKGARTSGSLVFFLYWGFCIALPSSIFLPMELLSNNELVITGLAFLIIPPFTFCLLRYRKEYRSAVMNHYQRSEWCKGIPVWLICSGWFPLCVVEFWVLIKMGW